MCSCLRVYASIFAYFAFLSIKSLLGGTSSPISIENTLSASDKLSIVTCRKVLNSGFIVVSHNCSGPEWAMRLLLKVLVSPKWTPRQMLFHLNIAAQCFFDCSATFFSCSAIFFCCSAKFQPILCFTM